MSIALLGSCSQKHRQWCVPCLDVVMFFVTFVRPSQDPPRHEVAAAVEDCREAGIRVMVITGDYKNTAEAICQEIGVLKPEDDLALCSFTTRDFMELRHSKRAEILRVSPLLVRFVCLLACLRVCLFVCLFVCFLFFFFSVLSTCIVL